MPPFLGGGEMIRDVRLDGFTPNDVPWKFEAGTPPIAEAVGLGAAIDYLERSAWTAVRAHEIALTGYAVGRPRRSASATTSRSTAPPIRRGTGRRDLLRLPDVHPHDLSQVLDEQACACGPATTAPSRSCAGSASGPPPGPRSTCTTTRPTSTPWPTPWPRPDVLRMSSDGPTGSSPRLPRATEGTDHARPRRPLPRDHPRPLPQPPEPGRAAESPPAHRVEGFNPLCGDEIVVYLDVEDGVVTDIRISGQGCSISQSSASMMSAAVKGKTVAEARATIRAFKAMMSIHERPLRRRRATGPARRSRCRARGYRRDSSATWRRCRAW